MTITVSLSYASYTSSLITLEYVVREVDCKPPPAPGLLTMYFESTTTWSFTDFGALAMDADLCGLGSAESFELEIDGSWTDVTSPDLPWISVTGTDLIVTIADPANITFDGRYSGKHYNGDVSEVFEILICAIHRPEL